MRILINKCRCTAGWANILQLVCLHSCLGWDLKTIEIWRFTGCSFYRHSWSFLYITLCSTDVPKAFGEYYSHIIVNLHNLDSRIPKISPPECKVGRHTSYQALDFVEFRDSHAIKVDKIFTLSLSKDTQMLMMLTRASMPCKSTRHMLLATAIALNASHK